MPVIIKEYKWSQTDSKLLITVPIPRASQAKTDIFISSGYIKASFQQYLFEAVLFDKIQTEHSKCTFVDNNIIFELIKCGNTQWNSLEVNLDKREKNTLKKQLIEDEYENIRKKTEEARIKKSELKRIAVREQIEEDTRIRTEIENVKKVEQKKALGDVNQWHSEVTTKSKQINHKLEAKPKNNRKIPPLRSTRSLQVIFTEREFPTPSRESKLDEENEWLRKQAEARRSAGFVSEDIRPEEKNPQFLKAKGDEFMKNQNYLGAISAYSFGIKICKNFVDLYIARSEAQLAIGN